ncbi:MULTISPECIES: hypothetical protein [unclassified Crossiella]|uniref:hypothetical protein n=1 Tax=unclassified Crossiella TaxID=2620835 RepID=UPI0020003209|nr:MULTISPECIES: hypothetical protein [unclassified Crossiella]MCK2239742.1 hypothetical protein [Crossiella sp. S99.2]MCK2252437.1 hypothetical protein [Crossiella sp. S99.1]
MNESAGLPAETILLSLGDFVHAEPGEQTGQVPWTTVVTTMRRVIIYPANPARFTPADLLAVEELRRAMQVLYDRGFRYLSARGELPDPGPMPPIG